MKLVALAFGLGLLMLMAWFAVKIDRPGPNVSELDALAVIRVMDGVISPADYCARRGPDKGKQRFERLATQYQGMHQAARDSVRRTFFAVPPAREAEFKQAQNYIEALRKNTALALSEGFRAELVIITEFLHKQCLQLL